MKKTMFKKVFAGIAAVFTLGLCVPTGFTNIITQPSFEAIAGTINYSLDLQPRFEVAVAPANYNDNLQPDKNGVLTVSQGTTIRDSQFMGNALIKEVRIGDKCRIRAKAFDDCATLTSVEIGEGCNIEKRAFDDCTSLTNVTMGNGCNIGEMAFWECTSLTNVTIGERCTIGLLAFDRCNSIQKVICIGDKNTVTVDDDNPEIICNKDKWLTATKCTKCQGPVIDYICEFCGYFDEAAAQAEIEKHKAEIEKHKDEIDLIQKLIDENTTNGGNTASTFSDGSVLAVIGGSAFLILCGLAAVIIVKRRKKTE